MLFISGPLRSQLISCSRSTFSAGHYEPLQEHKLQLVSWSPSCFTAFSALCQGLGICSDFCLLSLSLYWQVLFFLLIDASISKSQRILGVPFSRTAFDLCIYHLSAWSNFDILHNSQWIIFSTQSCLLLYSFCINLMHLFILWLIISFLSPHNRYSVAYYKFSSDIIGSLDIIMCYSRDSFFLFRSPLLSLVKIISWVISLVCRLKYPYSYFSSYFCCLDVLACCFLLLVFYS